MLGRIKREAASLIGRNRRSHLVRSLHRAAAFVESAYTNEGSNFSRNGEERAIRALRGAGIKIAFDVGANVGDWLMEALNAWPECHVHAFEVAPPTFERLAERVRASPHAARATLNCFGLSDLDQKLEMYYFPEHPELTCDRQRHSGHKQVVFEGKVRTADGYAREHGIEELDFLKIDVEGAEYKVLKGVERLLEDGRVQMVQFEYGAFSIQTRMLLADYYQLLTRYWIGKIYPTYVDFRDYEWTMEDFRFANFIAVSRSRQELRKLLE